VFVLGGARCWPTRQGPSRGEPARKSSGNDILLKKQPSFEGYCWFWAYYRLMSIEKAVAVQEELNQFPAGTPGLPSWPKQVVN
jgi:hypothetical protein